MSISTLQEKFFNKGCGGAILAVAAIAMVASMFSKSDSSRNEASGSDANSVVTVGNVPVPASLFQTQSSEMAARAMSDQAAQMKIAPESLGRPNAAVQALATVQAVGVVLQKAAVEALATRTPVTEEEISSVGAAIMAQRLDGARQSLVRMGKLKANASEAELEKALKDQLGGKTLAQLRAESQSGLLKDFKDSNKKASVVSQFAGPLLVQRLGSQKVGSDQALKDSYKSYVVRRIFLSSTSGSTEKPEVRAAKAKAELKSGKSFDVVMDELSNDPAPAGKKPHDVTETVQADAFDARPELADLKGKKANAVSGVVDVPGGKAIYQLVSVKDQTPADFEKNKASLRALRIQTLGQAEAEKQVKAFIASDAVKWKSSGYQALAAVAEAIPQGFAFDSAAIKKATDAALVALKSENASDRRLGTQALLVITDPKIAIMAKPGDVSANRRLALESAPLNGIQDAALSLELAGLYADLKDGAKATQALIAASKANDDYEVNGQRIFGEIASKALDLQKKNVLTKDQLATIQAQQAIYSATRVENEKLAREAKANAAKEKAANDAELARQKAESEKSGASKLGLDDAAKKANAAELARQKAEASKKPASNGGSILPTTTGGG